MFFFPRPSVKLREISFSRSFCENVRENSCTLSRNVCENDIFRYLQKCSQIHSKYSQFFLAKMRSSYIRENLRSLAAASDDQHVNICSKRPTFCIFAKVVAKIFVKMHTIGDNRVTVKNLKKKVMGCYIVKVFMPLLSSGQLP